MSKKWSFRVKINDTFCEYIYYFENCNNFSIEDFVKAIEEKLKIKSSKGKLNVSKYKRTKKI